MNHDSHDALVKIFWTWFFFGVSQMSPLQVVQFLAGIVATVYSSVQLYVLVRDKILKGRR